MTSLRMIAIGAFVLLFSAASAQACLSLMNGENVPAAAGEQAAVDDQGPADTYGYPSDGATSQPAAEDTNEGCCCECGMAADETASADDEGCGVCFDCSLDNSGSAIAPDTGSSDLLDELDESEDIY